MAKIRSGKPHPRFGATSAQERHNAEVRDLKNQIFSRDMELEALRECIKGERAKIVELEAVTRAPVAQIQRVVESLTLVRAVDTGVLRAAVDVLAWLNLLSSRHMVLVATGNKETT